VGAPVSAAGTGVAGAALALLPSFPSCAAAFTVGLGVGGGVDVGSAVGSPVGDTVG
jgi:hypothetical protein